MNAADQHMELCRRFVDEGIPYSYADDHRIGCIAREVMIQAWETMQARHLSAPPARAPAAHGPAARADLPGHVDRATAIATRSSATGPSARSRATRSASRATTTARTCRRRAAERHRRASSTLVDIMSRTVDMVASDSVNARIAVNVRALRLQLGLSLEALAAACGVSRGASLIERAESEPDRGRARQDRRRARRAARGVVRQPTGQGRAQAPPAPPTSPCGATRPPATSGAASPRSATPRRSRSWR